MATPSATLLGFVEYIIHPDWWWLQLIGLLALVGLIIGYVIWRRKQM